MSAKERARKNRGMRGGRTTYSIARTKVGIMCRWMHPRIDAMWRTTVELLKNLCLYAKEWLDNHILAFNMHMRD
jgi:hypothetical protein